MSQAPCPSRSNEPETSRGPSWFSGGAARLRQLCAGHWLVEPGVVYYVYRHPLPVVAALLLGGSTLSAKLPDFAQPSWRLGWLVLLCLAVAYVLLPNARRSGATNENTAKRNRWIALGFIGLLCIVVGGFVRRPVQPPEMLAETAGRAASPLAFRAVVRSAPSWRPNGMYRPDDPNSSPWRTVWDIGLTAVRDGKQWRSVQTRSTLAIDGRIDKFLPGDDIEVLGSYSRIWRPTNPGEFDFAKASSREQRYITCRAKTVEQVTWRRVRWHWWPLRLRAQAVKYVDHSVHRFVPEAYAGLAAALVFGQREQVDWEKQQQLVATGTLHLLAISGMHVEFVASAIGVLCWLLRLRPSTTFLILAVVCVLYATLAGGKPPVLRAVVVVLSIGLGKMLGKPIKIGNILGLAAIVLLAIRSDSFENVGVQLSFLAVAVIAVFARALPGEPTIAEAIEELLDGQRGFVRRCLQGSVRFFTRGVRLSCWVWLITVPLTWSSFHVVAPVSVLLNVVVSPALLGALLLGLATPIVQLCPFVGDLLAAATGHGCGACLWSIERLVVWGNGLPFGHFWLPAPSNFWSVGFFCIVVGWLLTFGAKFRPALAIVLIVWLLFGIVPMCFGPHGYVSKTAVPMLNSAEFNESADAKKCHALQVTFLDVGHGTSVILRLPSGEIWLYDAGRMGADDRSFEVIAHALWEMKTARIDRVIISHADADHYNAVEGLADRFAVGELVSTPQFYQSQDTPVQDLLTKLRRAGIVMTTWSAGEADETDLDLKWRVLHPSTEWQGRSDNADSLVLLVEHRGKRVLLPGDLEKDGLLSLVDFPPRPVHILMAPHHGSSSLDPSDLLQWCRPTWTVVSGNHRAMREKVLVPYLRGSDHLAVTFREGAVRLTVGTDGEISAQYFDDGWREIR